MFKNLSFVMMILTVLTMVVGVQAADVTWTGAAQDQDWNNATNWDTGAVPVAEDVVHINGIPGPVVSEDVTVDELYIGRNEPGALTVLSGNFRCSKRLFLAAASGEARLDIYGGVFTSCGGAAGGWSGIGDGGKTTVNIFGGEFTSTNPTVKTDATVNLFGGHWASWGLVNNEGSLINVQGGSFRAGRNGQADPTSMQTKVDEGLIVGYNGTGVVNVAPDGGTFSRLTATHPLSPDPNEGLTLSNGPTTLSWTLPTADTKVDVYISNDFYELYNFVDPESMLVVDKQNVSSYTLTTEVKNHYFWAVDTYVDGSDEPIYGPIFFFYADNLPPVVDAGADVVTYLDADGQREGALVGSVEDTGGATAAWTIVSEPDDPNSPKAEITDASAAVTTIKMSAVGEYVLQLEGSDGEYSATDEVTLTVYSSACEATKVLPDYVPLVGDLNGDCKVDELDEALMKENWLKDITTDEEWIEL